MPIINTPAMNYNSKKKEKTVTPVANTFIAPTPGYVNRNAQQSPLITEAITQAKDNVSTASTTQSAKARNNILPMIPGNRITSSATQTNNPTAKTSILSSGVADKVNALRDANSAVRSQISATNSTSSGSGGSSGGSSASSALAEQQAKQAAAQNYYNNNLSALQNAYSQKLAGLQSNLASTQDLLKSNFNLSKDNLYSDAERALQEAYINRMMNERALQQQLNAQGLTGGATESAIASMLNNYGTSRNNINTAYNSNLAQLEQAYLNNLAQAQQDYNNAVAKAASDNANYRMELENALYRAMLG